MPEFAFIEALRAYLGGPAGLLPAPSQIGLAEPTDADEAPAVVLSLESVRRLRGGLGEGANAVSGILPWTARIDLAQPFLPGEPGFKLISDDHRTLTLPHGGLIRADGEDGPLRAGDLSVKVTVAGQSTPRTLVGADPSAGQFSAEPMTGQLTFGDQLAAASIVEATYHLGAWERRTFLIAGDLLLTAYAVASEDAAALSAAVGRALARPGGLAGLKRLSLVSLGPVARGNVALGNLRAQGARYAFEFEHVLDAPASSGGIIQTATVITRTPVLPRHGGAEEFADDKIIMIRREETNT